MEKILLSACLLGQKVRYDGADCLSNHPVITKWQQQNRIVTLCPEMAGGLPVPRPPAEIIGDGGGLAVLQDAARIHSNLGTDVTDYFRIGAEKALALCQQHNVKVAVLKARSPSCGSRQIYDGSFSSTKIDGMGVTAALLHQSGITVFDEEHLDEAAEYLETL